MNTLENPNSKNRPSQQPNNQKTKQPKNLTPRLLPEYQMSEAAAHAFVAVAVFLPQMYQGLARGSVFSCES